MRKLLCRLLGHVFQHTALKDIRQCVWCGKVDSLYSSEKGGSDDMEQLSEEWFYSQGYLKNKQGCWYKDPNSYSTNPINQSQQYSNQAQRKQSEDKDALIAELVGALNAMWKHFGDLTDNEMLGMPCKNALQKTKRALSTAAKMGYGKE